MRTTKCKGKEKKADSKHQRAAARHTLTAGRPAKPPSGHNNNQIYRVLCAKLQYRGAGTSGCRRQRPVRMTSHAF